MNYLITNLNVDSNYNIILYYNIMKFDSIGTYTHLFRCDIVDILFYWLYDIRVYFINGLSNTV